MTGKQFYDWQTLGGTDDVMRFVNALEKADIVWCAIDGIAVNHWAAEQMVTQDVDFVVAADSIDLTEKALKEAGFSSERFDWSINFRGKSKVSIELTTEDFYRDFAERGLAADVHGILLRVASLEDTLAGKVKAWGEPTRRQSKQAKDFTDIVRLVESHPQLWLLLTDELKAKVERPSGRREAR
ncbi:MAG: nucleotidyl transferase AbiEii/AbiGii toxin family protein [Chloracidobacterium sp.]|nr:nucleotidyl transferase AbiEii/AbiGii toxin family protein [Chloracidobacterium sp.]